MTHQFVDNYQIEKIIKSLTDFALRDLKFIRDQDVLLVTFLAASCFIDVLGGIMAGKRATGKTYRRFIKKYLTQYDTHNLYEDLRCALAHNYSVGRNYSLIRQNSAVHLKTTTESKIVINVEDFVNEVEAGFHQFVSDLRSDRETGENATAWSRKYRIIELMQVDIPH